MDIKDLVPVYLDYCRKQKRLDAKTLKAYRADLGQLSQKLPHAGIGAVTDEDLESVFWTWHEAWKPKTVKRKMASVKAFFRWAAERGYRTDDPFQRIHTHFREPKTLPRVIAEHDLERFLQFLYDQYHRAPSGRKALALRDVAVIEFLFGTGVRISELCQLSEKDIDLVEGNVRIYGKGRKERIIQIPDQGLRDLLSKYRDVFQGRIRESGRFFVNDRGMPLSESSARAMVQRTAQGAGITKHITPHMFRHTFATLLLESDVNIRCIQELLGHSSIQTTEIYTHVSAAKQRQVLAEHHPRKQLHIQV